MRDPRISKVCGQAVFARDALAHNLQAFGLPPDAPVGLRHAVVVRSRYADRPVSSVDIAAICREFSPFAAITATDLSDKRVLSGKDDRSLGWLERDWLVPDGSRPEYLGQPVAMLIFDDANAADTARSVCRDQHEFVRYGTVGYPSEQDIRRISDPLLGELELDMDGAPHTTRHYIRWGEHGSKCEFSHVRFPNHDPRAFNDRDPSNKNWGARRAVEDFEREILERKTNQEWSTLERTFYTQITDPMFLEPESGVGWWDHLARRLHLILGTQSPGYDRNNLFTMIKASKFMDRERPPIGDAKDHVVLHNCDLGGGFGGRDLSSFPYYLAIAALWSDQPVRLAWDREEQFEVGIKRHSAVIRSQLSYSRVKASEVDDLDDDEIGKPQALRTLITLNGGGTANLTRPVLDLALVHAAGAYRIPRTVLSGVGVRTRGASAGSMRGFGIPQATFAIESMMDELGELLDEKDLIEFRERNVRVSGDIDVVGMKLSHHLANREICRRARSSTLWTERHRTKERFDRPGVHRYGVGFALCMQAYGTSKDAALAGVEFDSNGRVYVMSNGVEMGQGTRESLRSITGEVLGQPAHEVVLGDIAQFDVLQLRQSKVPTAPNETPKYANTMSASITAFFLVQAVREAASILYDLTVAPIATARWGRNVADAHWVEGRLCGEGVPPLSWSDIWRDIVAANGVDGVRLHTYFMQNFATATFNVDGTSRRLPIDALAIRRQGAKDYELQQRDSVTYRQVTEPAIQNYRRTLYASSGHLVAVDVNERTGRVRLLDAVCFLDAGDVHNDAALRGQVDGGFAMGVGSALSEEIPEPTLEQGDPLNLHRYQVPRTVDLPPAFVGLELVPLSAKSILADQPEVTARKKGIAEAVMTTVAPAVANAVAHAIGKRLNRMPITPDRVREALAQ